MLALVHTSLAVASSSQELAAWAVEHEHAAQKPDELARLVEWLGERPEPRTVLEVGSFKGGTLWLWRRLWRAARIVAVDDFSLEPCEGCARRRAHSDCPHRRIEAALGRWPRGRLLSADSHAESSRARVTAWLEGGCDFLHIDGDHSAEGVRRDVELYGPLVRPGGAMVLHDVAGDAFPGVVELWRELEREPGAFLILEGRADWGGLGVVPR
ncbi:MAG: class I SAM-dependent methyltransferase [Candidatus Rokuibacteriota bacterium]